MKALVKSKAEKGLWLEDVAEPEISINDCTYSGVKDRHLRYRCPYLRVGCVGTKHDKSADRSRS